VTPARVRGAGNPPPARAKTRIDVSGRTAPGVTDATKANEALTTTSTTDTAKGGRKTASFWRRRESGTAAGIQKRPPGAERPRSRQGKGFLRYEETREQPKEKPRHSRVSGNPESPPVSRSPLWIPAYAGMTRRFFAFPVFSPCPPWPKSAPASARTPTRPPRDVLTGQVFSFVGASVRASTMRRGRHFRLRRRP
jgi:hypothetical protein